MFLTLSPDPLQKTVMTVLGSTAQFLNVSKIKEEVINNAYLTAIVISIFQDLSHFCHPGTRTTARELDPPSAGDSTGLPIGSIIIHPCGGCLSGVYVTIMSERIPHWFSVAKRVILCTLVVICRRHDILHPGILGGCAHLVHHDEPS